MNDIPRIGRALFALATSLLGVQQLATANLLPTLVPVEPSLPGRSILFFASTLVLVAGGVGAFAAWRRRETSAVLAGFWLLDVAALHAPRLAHAPRNGGAWTAACEALAIGGASLLLAAAPAVWRRIGTRNVERDDEAAGSFGADEPAGVPTAAETSARRMARAGRYLFAVTLPVFGVQHFLYTDYVSAAVPSWIPAPVFWAYFTGVAHVCAGLALLTGVKARLAAALLALMFGSWFVILHLPRVAAKPGDAAEWTSAFVALAMCGASLMLAGRPAPKV